MHYINICNQANKELFHKSLEKIKKTKGFEIQGEVLQDVDCSLIAVFKYNKGKVILINDEDTGALFIKSDKNIKDALHI